MKVCLVTPAHIANNPRLVKEADALTAAGHDVRVVAVVARPDIAARDATAMAARRWTVERVRAGRNVIGGRVRWAFWSLVQAVAVRAYRVGVRPRLVRDLAVSRLLVPLARAAASTPADLVVAHNLAALPAAARAAARLGARLGFDAEDLHVEELPDTPEHRVARALARSVEHDYLPRCARLTASSPGIADELSRRYAVARPLVVLNVFPRASGPAPRRDRVQGSGRQPLALYWYSQVIGPGRGLEEALEALALLRGAATLHLRGAPDPAYRRQLSARCRALGIEPLVHFLAPAPPDDLVTLASEYDVGLALEQPATLNRALCVTNKLLTYLGAGLAVAATDTPGQRTILEDTPGAGFLYPAGDAARLAEGISRWAADRSALAAAQDAARAAARRRYSWERESSRLVDYLTGSAVRGSRPRPTAGAV
jgi:glycosyltransferase involved in cell wall biosynthesis